MCEGRGANFRFLSPIFEEDEGSLSGVIPIKKKNAVQTQGYRDEKGAFKMASLFFLKLHQFVDAILQRLIRRATKQRVCHSLGESEA